MYNPSPPASLKLSGTERAQGEQYAGERATYDNASIIVKGGSPAHGTPRRAYRPAYGGACGRYAAGEGTPPCWAAAPMGRHTMARAGRGQAGRRVVGWAQGNRPCCPVRQQADSPAYCRLPVGAKARLLAFKLRATLSSNARKVQVPGKQRRNVGLCVSL
jgi:hypothetical protein